MVLGILLGIFLIMAEPSGAETYYVDSSAGKDANPGTSEAFPWKTISRVNMKRFAAGDTILFKRSSEWFDVMINVEAPDLTFGAYGTGEAPRLVGSVIVKFDEFKSHGKGVYYTFFPRPLTRKDWTNWEVQLVMETGNRFYRRVDSLDRLTDKGQFYYNKHSQNLYVKPLDPAVSSKTFFVGRQENVFEIRCSQINNLTIRDLEISLANRYGIGPLWQGDKATQGSVLIENNTFIGNAFSAVCLSGAMSYDRIDIRNNIIRMSGAEGIYIGRNAARTAVEITGNIVGDPADPDFGWRGEGPESAFNGDGIEVKTGNAGVLIAGNTLRNLGYSGCGICTGSTSALITDNLIQGVSLPGSKWTNPSAGIFVDMDDAIGTPVIRRNRIFLSAAAGIHVRGNAVLHPPLVIEENEIELTPENQNAQIIFSVLNSRNVKITGNKCRGGAYGLAFVPADDPPVGYVVKGNDFLKTSKSIFYFAQPSPAQLKGLTMKSNSICKTSPMIIEWKSSPAISTIPAAKRLFGPESIQGISCP